MRRDADDAVPLDARQPSTEAERAETGAVVDVSAAIDARPRLNNVVLLRRAVSRAFRSTAAPIRAAGRGR